MLSDFGTSAGDTLNDGFTLNEPKQGMRVLIKTQWDSGVSAHESVQTHVNDSTQRSLQACTRKGERESGALNEKVDPNQCVAWSVRNLIAWTSPALSLSKQAQANCKRPRTSGVSTPYSAQPAYCIYMSAGETLAQGITVITTPHRSPIRWLAWDSTGYYLVSVDTYGQVCLWGMRDFNANDWDCLYQSDKKDNQEVLGLQWWTSGVRSVVRSTGADSSGKALKGTPSNANTLAGIPAFSTSYPSSAPNGPQVPLGKLAFSVVTSSGDMRVFYRESRSRAISVSTYRLAPVTSPRLTAVAIGFYEHGEVLVATTHTSRSRAVPSAHVTVYHVQIGFTASDDFPAKSGVSFNARASHQWDLYDGLKLEKDDEAQPSNPETRQRARSKNRNIPTNCVLSFSPTKRELYCALVVQGIANQNTSGEVDQPKTNGHDTSNGIGGVLDTSILAKDTIGDALLPSDTMHTDTYTDIPTLTHAHVHEHIPPSFSRQTSKNTLKHTNTSPLLSLETAKINARAYLLSWQLRPVTLSANPNSVFGTNNPKFLQNQKHWKISAQTSWDIGNSIEEHYPTNLVVSQCGQFLVLGSSEGTDTLRHTQTLHALASRQPERAPASSQKFKDSKRAQRRKSVCPGLDLLGQRTPPLGESVAHSQGYSPHPPPPALSVPMQSMHDTDNLPGALPLSGIHLQSNGAAVNMSNLGVSSSDPSANNLSPIKLLGSLAPTMKQLSVPLSMDMDMDMGLDLDTATTIKGVPVLALAVSPNGVCVAAVNLHAQLVIFDIKSSIDKQWPSADSMVNLLLPALLSHQDTWDVLLSASSAKATSTKNGVSRNLGEMVIRSLTDRVQAQTETVQQQFRTQVLGLGIRVMTMLGPVHGHLPLTVDLSFVLRLEQCLTIFNSVVSLPRKPGQAINPTPAEPSVQNDLRLTRNLGEAGKEEILDLFAQLQISEDEVAALMPVTQYVISAVIFFLKNVKHIAISFADRTLLRVDAARFQNKHGLPMVSVLFFSRPINALIECLIMSYAVRRKAASDFAPDFGLLEVLVNLKSQLEGGLFDQIDDASVASHSITLSKIKGIFDSRPQLLSNANHPAYYLPELMRKLDLMGNPKARCLVQQKPEVTLSFFPPLPPTGASAYEGHDDLQRTLTVDVIRFATIPPTKHTVRQCVTCGRSALPSLLGDMKDEVPNSPTRWADRWRDKCVCGGLWRARVESKERYTNK